MDDIDLSPSPQPDGNDIEHFQVSDIMANHEVSSDEEVLKPRPRPYLMDSTEPESTWL